ncbi:MAG TPA: S26 family signal peptidase, partial [Sumerlaeia bacterium]|nr:S26 family signal peptidase [Sumerlaeia bacterium]
MTAVAKSSPHTPSGPKKDSRGAQREPAPPGEPRGFWPVLSEWTDALVVAFLLAMFIRLFAVELFKIPSGSMTPTLLGSEPGGVSFFDVDGDNDEDMIVRSNHNYLVYLKENKRYHFGGRGHPGNDLDRWMRRRQTRQDRIIVAKFLYWFSPPKRGDIAVFKPPEPSFDPSKPVYIKRVVGLPGETLSFEAAPGVSEYEHSMGRLAANGERVESPEFFRDQLYQYR